MKKIISLLVILALTIIGTAVYFVFFNNTFLVNSMPKQINSENETQSIGGTKVVAIGDSLTAGYGLNISESYPAQLEKALREKSKDVEVVNMGVSGETTAGLLERVDFIKKQNPDIVLITIGGNDALRALPTTATEQNITQIIQKLKEVVDQDHIYLANIQAPGNLGLNYTSKFNRVFSDIAIKERVNLMQFVIPEVFTNSSYMQNDGIHPNASGYKVIIDKHIVPSILQQIK